MKVTVTDRAAMKASWGHGPFSIITKTIEISDRCPTCSEPRGKPWEETVLEDGDSAVISRWTNPCGHLDKYDDCIKEARLREELE